MTTCQRHLNSAYNFAQHIIQGSSFGWRTHRMAEACLCAGHEKVSLYIPAEEFEQFASVIVRVQDFRFGLRC